jgi:hypothetical protein
MWKHYGSENLKYLKKNHLKRDFCWGIEREQTSCYHEKKKNSYKHFNQKGLIFKKAVKVVSIGREKNGDP